MIRKYVCLKVLAVLILTSLTFGVTGCGSENSTAGKQTESTGTVAASKQSETEKEKLYEKQLEISWMGDGARGNIEDGNWVQKKIESMFNVKLTNKKVNNQNTQQLSLMLSSGEMPDLCFLSTGTPLSYFEDGLTRTIPQKLIKEYAPRYSKMLDEEPLGWKINLAPGKTDEYLSLTGKADNIRGLLYAPTYRLDWMESLGIKPPDGEEIKPVGPSGGRERIFFTKKAFTLEEIEKIFIAFTRDDPDKNNTDDTYAISMNNADLRDTFTIMGAFGIAEGYNLEEDGKAIEFAISNKYKEYVKLMARWYKLGLIDPEFTTLNIQKQWEKYSTGKFGYMNAQYSYIGMDQIYITRAPQNLVVKDPNVKLLVTAPEIGPDGRQGAKSFSPVTTLAGNTYINKNVSDEKLIRILQIFDYINLDEEASLWSRFGLEGEHFEWEGTPNKSAPLVKAGLAPQEGNLGFWYYNHRIYTPKEMCYFTSEYSLKLVDDFFFNPDYGMKMTIRPFKADLFNETKYAEYSTKYLSTLKTIEKEYLFMAITGEKDVDSTWDNYVKSWMDAGGSYLLEELQKMPKTEDLRNMK